MTGTGGGYGDPAERDRDLVAADLRDGLITAEEANDVYGLDPDEPAGPSGPSG